MSFCDVSTISDFEPVAAVLGAIQAWADPLGIDVLVVGATARNVVVRHLTGAPPLRATRDIDIAVAVRSWAELDSLTVRMNAVGGAECTSACRHWPLRPSSRSSPGMIGITKMRETRSTWPRCWRPVVPETSSSGCTSTMPSCSAQRLRSSPCRCRAHRIGCRARTGARRSSDRPEDPDR
jgi:hypothetical protein